MFQYVLHGILQIADAIVTYLGIMKFGGTFAEGNVLIRSLMDRYGIVETLIGIKCLSIFILVFFWNDRCSRKMLGKALVVINLLYGLSFVFWMYVLLTQ